MATGYIREQQTKFLFFVLFMKHLWNSKDMAVRGILLLFPGKCYLFGFMTRRLVFFHETTYFSIMTTSESIRCSRRTYYNFELEHSVFKMVRDLNHPLSSTSPWISFTIQLSIPSLLYIRG